MAFLTFALVASTNTDSIKKAATTVTRTELKVSRSLNPDQVQTLNVMTRDGSVSQLIVKRRDSRSQTSSGQADHHRDIYNGYRSLLGDYKRYGEYKPDYQIFNTHENYQNLDEEQNSELVQYPKPVFTKWIPVQSVHYQPQIITLDGIAIFRNTSNIKPLGNIIDSDR